MKKVLVITTIISGILTAFYFCIPALAKKITAHPTFASHGKAYYQSIGDHLQSAFVFPFGKYLSSVQESIFVFPYLFLIFFLLLVVFRKTKRFWKWFGLSFLVVFVFLYIFPNCLQLFENKKASQTIGTVGNGSIKHAKRMYFRGENYTTYSFPLYLLGRTYVHNKVRETMVDSYAACSTTCPDTDFVIGETGWPSGGSFPPHRTHKNGMSVDFMTPMIKNGNKYRTHHLFNVWGYGIEFDQKGKKGNIEVDYEVMAQHILALKKAAAKNGLYIQKIIFDPIIRGPLFETSVGAQLRDLPWTKKRVIIRHDDHYHVDFAVK